MPAPRELKHIGFIMDGNGRWATARGLSRHKGHESGAKSLQRIIRHIAHHKIPFATFFVFSSENWGRPAPEVQKLLALLERSLRKDLAEAHKNNARIRFVGDVGPESRLKPSLIRLIEKVQAETAENDGVTLNICFNYGGRDEIVRTCRALANKIEKGEMSSPDVTEESFHAHSDLAGCPPVDICIRTGGEKRISNFVLWHLSYAELFFTDTYWPAFSEQELDEIIERFQGRNRRFGQLPENTVAVGE